MTEMALNRICAAFFIFLLCFVAGTARARQIDFVIRGQWIVGFGYGGNGAFEGSYKGHVHTGWGSGQDSFEAKQKLAFQLETFASENLGATLGIEMGDIFWGQRDSGGALGADISLAKVNNAYIDVIGPKTKIKARIGIFGFSTPAMASGNSIYNGTAPGITLNIPIIHGHQDMTFFWTRLFNDNYAGFQDKTGNHRNVNFHDNVDSFGLLLPFYSERFSITPYLLYSINGPNTFRSENNTQAFGNLANINGANIYRSGMFPVGGARHRDFSDANTANKIKEFSHAWWIGVSGSFNPLESLRVTYDATYGGMRWERDSRLNRQGWFLSGMLEYLFDWGVPGIYFWESSGDDANPANGSERLPALDGDDGINFSHFAFNGSPYIERNSVIASNLAGTRGIGFRIVDAEFVKGLIHTFRCNLISGSNSPAMAKKMSLAGLWANGQELTPNDLGFGARLGMPNLYLTSLDRAYEVSSTATYKVFENFLVCVEGAYVALNLDTGKKAWGARHRLNQSIPQTRDAWNLNLSFVCAF